MRICRHRKRLGGLGKRVHYLIDPAVRHDLDETAFDIDHTICSKRMTQFSGDIRKGVD